MKLSRFQAVSALTGVWLSIAAISPATADPVTDLEECASIQIESERLACFDAGYAQLQASGLTSDSILESRVIRVKVPVPVSVPVASPAGGALPQPAAEVKSKGRFSGFGLPFLGRKKDETPESFGKPAGSIERDKSGTVKSMTAKVVEVKKNPYGRLLVTLDNGQTWKQGEGRIKAKAGDTAKVRRGGAGGYFLSINNGRSVRATRIDDGKTAAAVVANVATEAPSPMVAEVEEKKGGIFSRFGRPFGGRKKDSNPDDFGKSGKATDEERTAEVKSMSQKVEAVLLDPYGNFIVTLENGQVWQQLDGRLKVRTGDVIAIDKGAMGGHFLQVNDEGRSVRVKRVD